MAGKSFIRLVGGVLTEILGIQSSAGAGNAGDIPALDSNGLLDSSFMPVGIGAETSTAVASEALSAGNWVNVYDNAGTATVRKADATAAGKEANGFVLAAFSSSATATVYTSGNNVQVTGQTVGKIYLSTTPGAGTSTAPSASGNVVQQIGNATSATKVAFQPQLAITKA